jgi:hypothetical protein
MPRIFPILLAAVAAQSMTGEAMSQEINARVTVLYNQVSTTVDRKVFQTLQSSLNSFINKRKWTADAFEAGERIDCSFLVNLTGIKEPNVYQAVLTVQAARPVYNTSYLSPLVNFQDNDLTFRYVEFQPVEFNENRVSGTEPLASNLTAVLAFYVYMILALDYDSFSPRGGDPYFQKALNIVNSAPDGRGISGWKPFDGLRNRYWLSENFANNRYALLHDAWYTYYRLGMDRMYENQKETREQMINAFNMLNTVNEATPNLMAIPFFFQGKSDEIVRVFREGDPAEKRRVTELLQKLDITNAAKYKQELK